MVGMAQSAELTSEPNPSYEATRIKISPSVARRLLQRHPIAERDAMQWGTMLHNAVDEARMSLRDFPASGA